jgi:hypothetical protein
MTDTTELALQQAVIHVGARLGKIETSIEEMTERLGRLELAMAQRLGTIDVTMATIAVHLDRMDRRLTRIERRLELIDEASS